MRQKIVKEVEVRFIGIGRCLRVWNIWRGTTSAVKCFRQSTCYQIGKPIIPVVDVRSGVRDSSGVLDIKVGLYTRVVLVISTTVDLDSGERGANGVGSVFLEECLKNNGHQHRRWSARIVVRSPEGRRYWHTH